MDMVTFLQMRISMGWAGIVMLAHPMLIRICKNGAGRRFLACAVRPHQGRGNSVKKR